MSRSTFVLFVLSFGCLATSCSHNRTVLSEDQKLYADFYNHRPYNIKVAASLKDLSPESRIGLVFSRLVSLNEIKSAIGNLPHEFIGFAYYSNTFGGYHSSGSSETIDEGFASFAQKASKIGSDVYLGNQNFLKERKPMLIRKNLENNESLRKSTISIMDHAESAKAFNRSVNKDGKIIYSIVLDIDIEKLNKKSQLLPIFVYLDIKKNTPISLARPKYVNDLYKKTRGNELSRINIFSADSIIEKVDQLIESE